MKPSERIEQLYEALMYSTDKKIGSITGRQVAIIQYLDEQAELLETRTVKEEKECEDCPRGSHFIEPKEQPTTPEKNRDWQSDREDYRNGMPLDKPMSYEVTCGLEPSPRERIQVIATDLEHSIIRNGQFGRTVHSQAIELFLQEQHEKSIKHSCGRV